MSEIPLPAGTQIIGDLHLDLEHEASVVGFCDWLERTRDSPALVILGDLFEYWVGSAQAETVAGRRVLAALAERVGRGGAVHVIPGNRDFLLDRSFEVLSGARLHGDGIVGRTGAGERLLILHGDELATLDRGYQRLRRVVRSRWVRGLARRLPLFCARAIARRLRAASRSAVVRKPAREKELQAEACLEQARRHSARTVVCGHAHRFKDELLADGIRWLVLDAFGGERDVLEVGERELAAVASGVRLDSPAP